MADKDVVADQVEGTDADVELSEDEQKMAALKEAIVIEKDELGQLRLKLTVTVPRDLLDERMGEQFDELKREAVVPGFRKGHAPLRLVEKRFAPDVGEQLKGQLISNGYLAAVEKEDLKPLGDPLFFATVSQERVDDNQTTKQVDVEQLMPLEKALPYYKLPTEGPLTFSCELELKPEFDLPKLDAIPIEKPTLSVSDEDVDKELTFRRALKGTFKPVEKGPVVADDMLYVDMKLSVESELIEKEDNFDIPARATVIKGIELPDLGKSIVGKKIGETLTCEANVPDDYDNIDIRGKQASFEFKILEIKRLDIPPIDDAFLASLGFESEKELRDAFRNVMEARLDDSLKRSLHEQIGDYLVSSTNVEVPAGLSGRQTERTISRRMIDLLQQGMPEAELAKHMDELRTKAADQVSRDLKLFFILEKIAEERDIDVSEEQLNAAIAQIAQRSNKRFDRVRDELTQGNGLSALYLQLRDEQILNALLADAVITDIASPKKSDTPAKKTKKSPAKKTAATATKTKAKAEVAKKAPKKTVKKAKKKS